MKFKTFKYVHIHIIKEQVLIIGKLFIILNRFLLEAINEKKNQIFMISSIYEVMGFNGASIKQY